VFEGFDEADIDVGTAVVHVRKGGKGPPLLLLHGHPRTHTTWHRVAPVLADRFTVVCPDLPGYGRSRKPVSEDHSAHSKRAMATDLVGLMRRLGHRRFDLVGHDRGGYVAHRLAADHPSTVSNLVILDGVPIGEALARCDREFASRWWHWFFLGQTNKPAERLINLDPDRWYDLDPVRMGRDNYEDATRAIRDPEVVLAMCEDYRAGLTHDRAADEADRASGRLLETPTAVFWARDDDMPLLYGDPREVWRAWARSVVGGEIPSGHHMSEEAPAELARALLGFLDREDAADRA
jgi:haloacetate dehalogenase